jgi:hypothetical protein
MSVERRERRRCDICGELITGEYYSCDRKTIVNCPAPNPGFWMTQGQGSVSVNGMLGSGSYQPILPPGIDVCPDCWEEMEKRCNNARS